MRAGMAGGGHPVLGALPRSAAIATARAASGPGAGRGDAAIWRAILAEAGAFVAGHVDLDALCARRRGGDPAARASAARLPPARPAHRPGPRCGVFLCLSASSGRLARGRGRDPAVFAAWPMRRPTRRADCCWLPGGYPELHAGRLAAAEPFPRRVCAALPQRARCMANAAATWRWAQALIDSDGHAAPRWRGFWALSPRFETRRMHLGYRLAELHGADARPCAPARGLRGHEFHYSTILDQPDTPLARCRRCRPATAVAETGSSPGPCHRHLLSPDRGGDMTGFVSFVSSGPGDPELADR